MDVIQRLLHNTRENVCPGVVSGQWISNRGEVYAIGNRRSPQHRVLDQRGGMQFSLLSDGEGARGGGT